MLFGNSTTYFILGAGIKVKSENFDNLNWMQQWGLYGKKTADETTFDDDGTMNGSVKRKLTNKGISIWSLEESEPIAGDIVYWNSKKWVWIHQGE